MNICKRILVFASICILSLAKSFLATAQLEKDTLDVLFVGNSYTYMENLPQIVSIISDSTKTKLITSKSVAGGASLKDHWVGGKGLKTKEIIQDKQFDFVVLQGQSMESIRYPDTLKKYSDLFCGYIKENGASACFFATWPREKTPQHNSIISNCYSNIAIENNAKVIPVGDAWCLAQKHRPCIELYSFDGSHPSKLGAFLTACVIVSKITNEIPNNITSIYKINDVNMETVLLMYIDPLDVLFCKDIISKLAEH